MSIVSTAFDLDALARDIAAAGNRGQEKIAEAHRIASVRHAAEARRSSGSVSTRPDSDTDRLLQEGQDLQLADRRAVTLAALPAMAAAHRELVERLDATARPFLEALNELATFEVCRNKLAAPFGGGTAPTTLVFEDLATRYDEWRRRVLGGA